MKYITIFYPVLYTVFKYVVTAEKNNRSHAINDNGIETLFFHNRSHLGHVQSEIVQLQQFFSI